MKSKTMFMVVVTSIFTSFSCSAQQRVTVEAVNEDISYNLDLQAVANLFGQSYDLEDFEMRLNDPNNPISNLDLNNDGYVDYLRVIEATERNTKLVIIQAILAKDVYQDVASIVVDRQNRNVTTVQVIGNSFIYGPNYCFEPIFVVTPPIYSWFWGPRWRVWYSPYYWGYYPSYYRYYSPFPVRVYVNHIQINYYNTNFRYNYTSVRNSRRVEQMSRNVSRNDFATRYPDRSFTSRNTGTQAKNRSQLRDIQPDRTAVTRDNNAGRNTLNNTRETGTGRDANTGTRTVRETTTRDAVNQTVRTREQAVENSRTNATETRQTNIDGSTTSPRTQQVESGRTGSTREVPVNSLESGSNSVNRTPVEGVSTQKRVSNTWQPSTGTSGTTRATSTNTNNSGTRSATSTSRSTTSSGDRSSATSGSSVNRSSNSSSSSSSSVSRPSSSSSSNRSSAPSSSNVNRSSSSSSSSSNVSRPSSSSSNDRSYTPSSSNVNRSSSSSNSSSSVSSSSSSNNRSSATNSNSSNTSRSSNRR